MAHKKPILVWLLLAALVSMVGVYLTFRFRSKIELPTTKADAIDESVDRADQSPLLAARTPRIARLAPRLPPMTAVESEATPDAATSHPHGDGGAATLKRPSPAAQKVWRQFRLVQQADELAFETLKIPETARAAIRKINDDYRPPKGSLIGSGSDGASAYLDLQDRTRRNAIDNVLGFESAKDFFAAEAAEKTVEENALQEHSARLQAAFQQIDQQAVDAGPTLP
jgi:hypothetical protein